MKIKEIVNSRIFKGILIGAALIIVIGIIFQAGQTVGYQKAAFSYRMGDNYHRIFGDRERGPAIGMPPKGLVTGHGVTGKIIQINLPKMVVESPDNTEQSVVMNDRTEIRRFKQKIAPGDLRPEDMVVVIGSPLDNGEISAGLIRLMPSGPEISDK